MIIIYLFSDRQAEGGGVRRASSAPTVPLAMGQKHQPGRNTPDVTGSGRCVWVVPKVYSFVCVFTCVCVCV